MKDTPWIVSLSDGKYTMLCKRCECRYTPALPVAIDMFLAMMESFAKSHSSCEEKQQEREAAG